MLDLQLSTHRASNINLPNFARRKLLLEFESFTDEQRSDYAKRATEYTVTRLLDKCPSFKMPRTLTALRQLAPWRAIRGVTVSRNHVYETLYKQINGSYSDDDFIEHPAFLLGKFDKAVCAYLARHPRYDVGSSYILQVYISRGCPYLLITEDRERWRVAMFEGVEYPEQRLSQSDLADFAKYHGLKAIHDGR